MGLAKRRVRTGLLLAAGLALGPVASAQAQPAEPSGQVARQEAKEYFERGLDAAKRGDCLAAVPFFERSLRAEPGRGALFNLALCQEKLGKLGSAWKSLETLLPQLAAGDDRQVVTREKMSRLEPRVPRLTVRASSALRSRAVVLVNGVSLEPALLGQELRVDPGPYEVVVRVEGHEDRIYRFELAQGASHGLSVHPGASHLSGTKPDDPATGRATTPPTGHESTPRDPAQPPDHESRGSWLPTGGYVIGGVGLVLLGTGVVTGALALDKAGQLKTTCPDPARCTDEGLALVPSGELLSTTSTVTVVTGLAALGAGVVLVWVVAPDDPAPVTIGAQAYLGGAGLSIARVF